MSASLTHKVKKENSIENWDDSYKDFETTYSENHNTLSNLANNVQHHMVYEDIIKFLPDGNSSKILEVGCGGARTSLFLALRGFDTTCTDYATEATRLAASNYAAMDVSGKIIQDNLLNSKLPGESFDCVMSFGLLEHFEDLQPVIKNITRLVRPGGIQIHNIITKKYSTQSIMDAVWFPLKLVRNIFIKRDYYDVIRRSYRDFPHYENSFSATEYCNHFTQEGNSILRCSPSGVLYPFVALPLGIGNYIANKFSNSLYPIIKQTNSTESKMLHLVSPAFYIVARKN